MEDKKSIRGEVRRRIKLMSEEEKQSSAAVIFAKVEATEAFARANCIALFVAMWDEVPTTEVLERWRNMGKRIVVPRVEGDIMRYYDYHPDKMAVGAFGIVEPTGNDEVWADAIDLMIVPARAFTPEGDRLGRGGGFYDKYLEEHPHHKLVALCYPFQMFDHLDVEAHDIPVDQVIAAE